jgi:hypothetical protein
VVTAGGSSWYRAGISGDFSAVYSRSELQLGSVAYVPGDFDGNGRDDIIVTTTAGSSWYFSQLDGTFAVDVVVDAALRLAEVQFLLGDFNGDGASDYAAVTASGAQVAVASPGRYFSFRNGPFESRAFLGGPNSILVADLTGDGHSDWWIADASGCRVSTLSRGSLYIGLATRLFSSDSCTFFPGDIVTSGDVDGDRVDDVVVLTVGGEGIRYGLECAGSTCSFFDP